MCVALVSCGSDKQRAQSTLSPMMNPFHQHVAELLLWQVVELMRSVFGGLGDITSSMQ